MEPKFSIVLVNYNGKGYTAECIGSVLGTNYSNFEIVLVDNASTDDSLAEIKSLFGSDSRLKIIRNKENLHFAQGNNIGIMNSSGEFIVLLNNDTEVDPAWLKEMALGLEDNTIGAAQPKILRYDNQAIIDNTGGNLDRYGYAHGRGHDELDKNQYNKVDEIFYAGATAMVIRANVLKEVGILDPKYLIYAEDVDLSWRIRLRGYAIRYIPKSRVYHKGSKTVFRHPGKIRVYELSRTNRLSTLVKNYSFYNLIRFLPVVIFFYLAIFLKEVFLDRNMALAFTSISALLNTIKNSSYLFQKRRIVQGQVRKVKDEEIIKYMYNKSILLEEYIRPLLKGRKEAKINV